MKKYRVFVAIPLPKPIKKQISYAIDRLENELLTNTFRFYAPELWHFTLLFLSEQSEESVGNIALALEDFSQNSTSFLAGLKEINYGPSLSDRRMIWLRGDKEFDQQGQEMRDKLQDLLISRNIGFAPDNKPFKAHATLARSRNYSGDFSKLGDIDEPISADFEVKQIELVSSVLGKDGPEYEVLSKFDLMR